MRSHFQMQGPGRKVAETLIIKIWDDGALSVEGPINETQWVLAVLENAKDAVRNHRHIVPEKKPLVVPARNVDVPLIARPTDISKET